ncbi:MAG: hypothetical protein JWO52_2391 [Gammaproteobacteria bacterium]|nr:hypothetical protein [Gammaproteobacteria bacterium]
MRDRVHLTTWLDRASKARFGVTAKARGLSESALLRQLVESTLRATDTVDTSAPEPVLPVASSGRISVRLRTDDLLFLRERASAHCQPAPMSLRSSGRICGPKLRFRRRKLRLSDAPWLKLVR